MHKNRAENFAGQKRAKTAKRTRKSQKKAKLGAFWVLEGMGTVVGRCERMGKPGNRAEGLVSPAGSGGSRHAVLEWMWKNASERGEGAVLPVFFCKTKTCGAGLVLFGSPVPKHALKVHWKSLSE